MAKKRSTLHRLLHCVRGTATTEAVIMLPFFAIVWGCIIYCSHKYERATEVQAVARGCAWRYAKDNCTGDTRCSIADGDDMSADIEGIGSASSAIGDAASSSGWGTIGSVVDFFAGKDVTATYNGSVDKPEVIGGGTASLVGQMALTCNEKARGPSSLWSLVSEAWSTLWHGL